MGWLKDITDWLAEQFLKLFNALVQLIKDAILWLIESVLNVGAKIVEMLPAPEFLGNVSIASMLGNAGPTVAWAVTTFKVAEAFALIGVAYAFRILRKVLTLGQW